MDLPEEVLSEVKPFMTFPNPSHGMMDLLLDFAEGTRVIGRRRPQRSRRRARRNSMRGSYD